jgi:hypothetical protein
VSNVATINAQRSLSTISNNPFLEHGKKYSGGGLGRILKFSKGQYESQGDVVPLGTQFIAHVDQVAVGWVKFGTDGSLIEQKIGKLIDGFVMPDRAELDCFDQSAWPMGRDGKKKDPWLAQHYLPLVGCEDETMVFTFVTATSGGTSAIGKLTQAFGCRDMDALPIIELAVEHYKHKMFGRVDKPLFTIVRWTDEPPQRDDYPFEIVHDEPTPVSAADSDIPF